jgi:hypothetical protein
MRSLTVSEDEHDIQSVFSARGCDVESRLVDLEKALALVIQVHNSDSVAESKAR